MNLSIPGINSTVPAILSLCLFSTTVYPTTVYPDSYEDCLNILLREGDDSLTLADIRQQCRINADPEPDDNIIEHRVQEEEETRDNRFTLTPHRPNYLLPLSYNKSPNIAPFEQNIKNFSSTEIKFQLSVKAPLAEGVFNGYGDIYVAYTNTSWWQAYNENSAPFRETNHEPEVFMVLPTDYQFFGFDMNMVAAGFTHQSNGRSGELSRSWNRLYAQFIFSKGNFVASIKPWWRIPEPEKEPGEENSSKGDDNPDIEKYMGYGELHLGYQIQEHNLGMMLRNNLRSDNKGAVQLDWSFPINRRFRGYIQYFNGYGESLIDYNDSANRLSVGVMLTDWL
ncbi:phospholipase A [Endozoicomonas sp.]|uniref:phospholipase A n=1 Tax=Endozoicomonas sp. TaxID=1892382 RepID=UPI002883FAF6|nr:phospholipase A [Endozoicomonas sp.]